MRKKFGLVSRLFGILALGLLSLLAACSAPTLQTGTGSLELRIAIPEFPGKATPVGSKVLLPGTERISLGLLMGGSVMYTAQAIPEPGKAVSIVLEDVAPGSYTAIIEAYRAGEVYARSETSLQVSSGHNQLARVLFPVDDSISYAINDLGYSGPHGIGSGYSGLLRMTAPESGRYTLLLEGLNLNPTLAWGRDGLPLVGHTGSAGANYGAMATGDSAYLWFESLAAGSFYARMARSPGGAMDSGFNAGRVLSMAGKVDTTWSYTVSASASYGDTLYVVGMMTSGVTSHGYLACLDAISGQLDTRFAGKGWIMLPLIGADDQLVPYSCVLQSAGGQNKILVSGTRKLGSGQVVPFLARFALDGNLDTSFGTMDGYWAAANPANLDCTETPVLCAVKSDGTIAVALTKSGSPKTPILYTILANGNDSSPPVGTSATGGTVRQLLAAEDAIYLGWQSEAASILPMVSKLNWDGPLAGDMWGTQLNFGSAGYDTAELSGVADTMIYAMRLAGDTIACLASIDGQAVLKEIATDSGALGESMEIQSPDLNGPPGVPLLYVGNGYYLIGGSQSVVGTWVPFLAKIDKDSDTGALSMDSSFNTNPYQYYSPAGMSRLAALHEVSGTLVMLGWTGDAAGFINTASLTLNPSAQPGVGTVWQATLAKKPLAITDVEHLRDGSIVAVGSEGPSGIILKYKADGTPDPSFGTNGKFAVSPAVGGQISFTSVLEQDSGALYVGESVSFPATPTYSLNICTISSNGQTFNAYQVMTYADAMPTPPVHIRDLAWASKGITDYLVFLVSDTYGSEDTVYVYPEGFSESNVEIDSTPLTHDSFSPNTLAVLPDGTITVVYRRNGTGLGLAAWTLNDLGKLDNLGAPYYTVKDADGYGPYGHGMSVTPAGGLYVWWHQTDGWPGLYVHASANLSPYPADWHGGYVNASFAGRYLAGAAHPDGRLLLSAISTTDGGPRQLYAFRLDGSVDTQFASGGVMDVAGYLAGQRTISAACVSTQGNLVLVGTSLGDNGTQTSSWVQVVR